MVWRQYSYGIPIAQLWCTRSIPMLHFWCQGAAPFLALLFVSLYRWLCRKVWDHFFCLQVDELTRKWVDKLMRKWGWRGSMSQYFYGFG